MTRTRAARTRPTKASSGLVGRYLAETGYAIGKPMKPPGKVPEPRSALAFEACKDGSLLIYTTRPDGADAEHWWDGEPIRIEPQRVSDVLAACGDALARKPSAR